MGKPLTHATIRLAVSTGVPPGKSQIVLRDMRPVGLGLRLRPGGSASWIYVYRPKGSPRGTPPRTVTIGAWPTLDLDAARREALKHVGKVAGGGDPAAELRLQRLKSR
ncbi:MAG TPA: Arm DNA-binding domain-containing protein, partial [Mesorhizobium sp.]|nr:Arm DNA-binding domain-containing protein [Mesorhizobium sp.]